MASQMLRKKPTPIVLQRHQGAAIGGTGRTGKNPAEPSWPPGCAQAQCPHPPKILRPQAPHGPSMRLSPRLPAAARQPDRHRRGIIEEAPSRQLSASLEEMLKRYAVQLVARLLHHEAEEYRRVECADRKTEDGTAAVVRNGYHWEREFLTGYGPSQVRVPRLRALDGKPLSCYSALVPR